MTTSKDDFLISQKGWLYVVARNMLRNFEEFTPEDLAQEGLIAMWRHYESHDPSRGASLQWYLRKRAKLRMIEVLMRNGQWFGMDQRHRGTADQRSNSMDPQEGDYLDAMSVGDNIDDVMWAYHEGEVARALDALTPKQREYVFRRFWLGEPVSEIKRAMQTNTSTMWASAKKRLEKELAHLAGV